MTLHDFARLCFLSNFFHLEVSWTHQAKELLKVALEKQGGSDLAQKARMKEYRRKKKTVKWFNNF